MRLARWVSGFIWTLKESQTNSPRKNKLFFFIVKSLEQAEGLLTSRTQFRNPLDLFLEKSN